MKNVELKTIEKIGDLIDKMEILIYLSHLVYADGQSKIILENEFQFTHKFAQDYLNDLLTKNLIEFKNAYIES